jgi:hypothetical protein
MTDDYEDEEKPNRRRLKYSKAEVEAMSANGRTPSFDSRGSIRGFRSRPGAPTVGSSLYNDADKPGMGGGLTQNSVWNNTFRRPTFTPQVQTVANSVPLDGGGINLSAQAPQESGFSFGAGAADSIFNDVVAKSTSYLTGNGITPPAPPRAFGSVTAPTAAGVIRGPVQYGDKITTKYGSGSVASPMDFSRDLSTNGIIALLHSRRVAAGFARSCVGA